VNKKDLRLDKFFFWLTKKRRNIPDNWSTKRLTKTTWTGLQGIFGQSLIFWYTKKKFWYTKKKLGGPKKSEPDQKFPETEQIFFGRPK
jgi:hypothetical protein